MNSTNIDLIQTGVSTIDAQHRKINDILGKFTRAGKNGTLEDDFVDEVIATLGDYMVTHFDDEEFLMRSLAYPSEELDKHILAHEEGKNMWSGLTAVLDDAGVSRNDILIDGVDMIYQWFLRHLALYDRGISYYVKNQRAEAAAPRNKRLF